ncbi:MAG: hypothetical protein ACQEP9_08595 [Bacillota bacterium]
MKRKYTLVKIVLMILIILVLTGCNESLLINDFSIDSATYKEEEYFLAKREVGFSVDIKNPSGGNLDYKWTANGGRFLADSNTANPKYLTPNLPGEYSIFLTVTNQRGQKINHQFSFTVKGDYPDEVSLDELSTTSVKSGVKIDWSTYSGDDFYNYKILRSNNNFIDSQAEVIATITDKSKSSYTDFNIKDKEVYSYQIMVINESGYLSVSNEKMIETLAQQVTEINLEEQLSDLVISATRSELYISNQQEELLVFDTSTSQVKQKINLGIKAEKMLLDETERYLFVLGLDQKELLRIDLADFSQKKFSFANEIKDISWGQEDLYLTVAGESNLIRFDVEEEQVVEKFKVSHNDNLVAASRLNISDSDYLFIDKNLGESLIYELDDLTKPIVKFDIGIVKNSIFTEVNDQTSLYVANTHHPLQLYSGIKSGDITLENKFDEIATPTDFIIDQHEERIFVATDKKIYIYSTIDNKLLDKIELQNYIRRLAWDAKQEKLYLLTAELNEQNHNLLIIDLD